MAHFAYVRVLCSVLLTGGLAFGCNAGEGGGDNGGGGDDSNKYGTCVPFEPWEGYTTCLMDKPQADPAATQALQQPLHSGGRRQLTPSPPVDLRTEYLDNCITVHDQGGCGWCVAHATNAALEALHCREMNDGTRISEPHLWWHGHQRNEFLECLTGWWLQAAATTITTEYMVEESLWPFDEHYQNMNTARELVSEEELARQSKYRADNFVPVAHTDVNSIKAVLDTKTPVMLAVEVFQNTGWAAPFLPGGHIIAPEQPSTCKCDAPGCYDRFCSYGYHAVLLVGHEDDETAGGGGWFMFLNSWGTDFAEEGYGRLAYDVVEQFANSAVYLTGIDDRNLNTGMVEIPGGGFMMGGRDCEYDTDPECPVHEVNVSTFHMDVTEVTQADWQVCVEAEVCEAPPNTGAMLFFYDPEQWADHPVTGVTWDGAQAYCEFVGKRLPTEAEWEKAARGTDGRRYPWGDTLPTCEFAVMDETSDETAPGCGAPGPYTHPVGSRMAGVSPYGVLDMAGNAPEWVADWYEPDYYSASPGADPTGPVNESQNPDCIMDCGKAVRGGYFESICFTCNDQGLEDSMTPLRADYRYHFREDLHYAGLRCAQ